MEISISRNNIPIRLTDERWLHISTGHPEVAPFYDLILETIEVPDTIYLGNNGDLIATKKIQYNDQPLFIVVVYKEISLTDGFIITAFLTSRLGYLSKKEIVWKQQK
jgi:hypothetical protein